MNDWHREAFRYTALFCEENIWWLARSLIDAGIDAAQMQVLLFANRWQTVILRNQVAATAGQAVAWDYHVVLSAVSDSTPLVLDFDTRLTFPTPYRNYFVDSFPPQSTLPERYRCWVRCIPAASYLAHFYSDRSHMIGRIAAADFPDYPIIRPAAGGLAISLSEYRDMEKTLPDGSRVQPLATFFPELA
jgi:hypothetical protein